MSQQPTFHITKEHFVGVINSLHEQYVKDKQRSEAMSEIFNCESGFYDNSALVNAIFSFLHEVFPKDDDGHSELLHYCYECNFGKVGDNYESPEELFDKLLDEKGIIVVNTPEGQMWCKVAGIKKEYPIAPEDAFTPHYDGEIAAFNADIMSKVRSTGRMMHEYSKEAMDRKINWDSDAKNDGVKTNPCRIDESGQFPGHKAGKDKDGAFYFVGTNDNPFSTGIQWLSTESVEKLKNKTSPDETA